ncbi:hypothetical protein O53_3989 [Microcystis aeruginosa TAIHU98]|uniref:Uncharacterized protein n=1 Tax=Microcystis aeruginosa TAIHU98 TaxID=1134457 RepID=L7E6S7_MICAE|nr:hypothetical protein O53_3989 [Microcystis aeruginosa TAIHU98]ODV36504.1 hypothetical protein BFG60_4028 [Microcystis aeruginosa NIES-98]
MATSKLVKPHTPHPTPCHQEKLFQYTLPRGASDFCQSTQWGFFQGNYLLKFALNGDFFLNPAAD